MGKVSRPEDILKGRRRLIEETLRDLTPGLADEAIAIFESWDEEKSESELSRLLGKERARQLLKKVKLD